MGQNNMSYSIFSGNPANERAAAYAWQSWFKGLAVGLIAGGIVGAYIEAVIVYSLI